MTSEIVNILIGLYPGHSLYYWCQWSDMVIRVDKCISFSLTKVLTRSVQYQPNLFINKNPMPKIK